ncbi:Uncharacterised protein [Bordetella pertussis]|nr:Uncharacterised protein [Bordetella pertussis]
MLSLQEAGLRRAAVDDALPTPRGFTRRSGWPQQHIPGGPE